MPGFKIALLEKETNKFKSSDIDPASLQGGGGFVDEHFDVGPGGQSNFTVAQAFTEQSKIDVWRNGIKQREGSGNSWQRNTSLNRIEFTSTVPENAHVEVRVYL